MKKIISFLVIIILFFGLIFYIKYNSLKSNFNISIDENRKNIESEPITFYGNNLWYLTQWGTNSNIDNQTMIFTIEGNKGGLVIIDGGYKDSEYDSDVILTKIKEHKNVVDAWIITHFDSDHVGQFLNVYENHPEIKIKQLYVQDAPIDINLLEENRDDDYSNYEEYLSLNITKVIKVHSNDIYSNIIGLKMKVLSSYDNWIDEKCDNLLNNGSIVFKLYGFKESCLFCGDIQSNVIGEYLLDNFKEDLKSDYLQVGHHGNNNLSNEFYDAVNPKVSFICLPDWIEKANISWYTVQNIIQYLKGKNSLIYDYVTSPNQVILY